MSKHKKRGLTKHIQCILIITDKLSVSISNFFPYVNYVVNGLDVGFIRGVENFENKVHTAVPLTLMVFCFRDCLYEYVWNTFPLQCAPAYNKLM